LYKVYTRKLNRVPSTSWYTRLIVHAQLYLTYPKHYNLSLSIRVKKESCNRLIQENLMEFQVQSVYLIYTTLMVHATLNLVYSKEHMLSIRGKYVV